MELYAPSPSGCGGPGMGQCRKLRTDGFGQQRLLQHTGRSDDRDQRGNRGSPLGNQVGEYRRRRDLTSAPLVVRDAVIIGNAGDYFGVRGWIKAFDSTTGQELWRGYSTGPDSDAGIGPSFRPLYPDDQGKDLGVSTWPPLGWQ